MHSFTYIYATLFKEFEELDWITNERYVILIISTLTRQISLVVIQVES